MSQQEWDNIYNAYKAGKISKDELIYQAQVQKQKDFLEAEEQQRRSNLNAGAGFALQGGAFLTKNPVIGGAMYGAGGAISSGKSPAEVAKDAVLGGSLGYIGGKVIDKASPYVAPYIQKVIDKTPQGVKNVLNTNLLPKNKPQIKVDTYPVVKQNLQKQQQVQPATQTYQPKKIIKKAEDLPDTIDLRTPEQIGAEDTSNSSVAEYIDMLYKEDPSQVINEGSNRLGFMAALDHELRTKRLGLTRQETRDLWAKRYKRNNPDSVQNRTGFFEEQSYPQDIFVAPYSHVPNSPVSTLDTATHESGHALFHKLGREYFQNPKNIANREFTGEAFEILQPEDITDLYRSESMANAIMEATNPKLNLDYRQANPGYGSTMRLPQESYNQFKNKIQKLYQDYLYSELKRKTLGI